MKLKYLLALPILATALMGCDEIEYSDAKPIENPQLEGITQDDFVVTPALALTQGLNLDALLSEDVNPDNYMVELYTVTTQTDALPSNAEISGGLELALTDAFDVVFNVDDVTVKNGVASAPLSSLLYTRTQMYGKDPREYTIYYRIPVYINVDGGQFKLGDDKDFYYCDGYDFPEEGADPGYSVEESYYLLGPNGTDIKSAIEFTHSGYNIYDDTIFTLEVAYTQGNTSWLVLPLSVYEAAVESGSVDASKAYGTSTPDALKGVLELGDKAGQVTEGKKYKFSINLATLEYTIEELPNYLPGDPVGIYLRGNLPGTTDWNPEPEYEFLATNDENVFVLPYLTLQSTEFKVADKDWGEINLGVPEGTQIVPGEVRILDGGQNIGFKTESTFVGSAILSINEDGYYTLLMQPFAKATTDEATGIYLRGGLPDAEDWSAIEKYEFQTSEYEGVCYLNDLSISQGVEFKVADSEWSKVNLGANQGAGAFNENTGTGILGLVDNGANISLEENFNGDLRLVKVNNNYFLYFLVATTK